MTYADKWVTPAPGHTCANPREGSGGSVAGSPRPVRFRTSIRFTPSFATRPGRPCRRTAARLDPRVLTSLERVRDMPFQKRYVIVDAGGRQALHDRGRPHRRHDEGHRRQGGPFHPNANAREHHLLRDAQSLLARRARAHSLTDRAQRARARASAISIGSGYQVMPADRDGRQPARSDEGRLARGRGRARAMVRVRQLPGPANSMGQLKFGFPNADDIYLHDTPVEDGVQLRRPKPQPRLHPARRC